MQDLIKVINTDRKELDSIAARLGLRGKMDLEPVVRSVTDIVSRVRTLGDEAIIEFTATFDKVAYTADELRVKESEIGRALDSISMSLLNTMRLSAANIRAFHQAQLPSDISIPTSAGGRTELVHRPLAAVGLYVPGGSAPLPSSVLMNAIPAKAAGVARLVMCTPPGPDGSVNPAILAAASIAGVDEIYKIGGAQAIAAMAYGTKTVPRVDKICGPGNIFVNTAKRMVYGQCDIDMFAGPSEILIIADESANPDFVAADLLSQAEHDPLSSSLLVTNQPELAAAVAKQLQERVKVMPRQDILRRSLADYGAIIVVPDIETAVEFSNELAPEHLELCLKDPDNWLLMIKNAGAVFLGSYSPEPLGDYFAGPNHVLPTSGTARFFSPLNTGDFIKKMSVIKYTRADLAACWQNIAEFADAESLPAHADAVRVRFDADIYHGRGI